MNHNFPGMSSNFNQAVNPQQIDQIVEAILAGKYSWACVLMLRIVGYNPLHYIPYRTYNRLLKENTQVNKTQQPHHQNHKAAQSSGKIKDLAYLEMMGKQKAEISASSIEHYSTQSSK